MIVIGEQNVALTLAYNEKNSYLCNQMRANDLKPFQPTHPGEVLKDELASRGISQRRLARELGISYSVLNKMLNGKRALTPDLAIMMALTLGVNAVPLLALQNEYDLLMAERNKP